MGAGWLSSKPIVLLLAAKVITSKSSFITERSPVEMSSRNGNKTDLLTGVKWVSSLLIGRPLWPADQSGEATEYP